MTAEEFKHTRFGANTKILHKEHLYSIASVDFDEFLIGLSINDEHNDIIEWVRCENCEIIQ